MTKSPSPQVKPIKKAYLVNVFGKRGSGKTTLIRGQLESFPPPIVVLDILGNFNEPEYIQTDSIAECIRNIDYYVKHHKHEDLQKVIVLKPSDPNLAIDYVSAALWESWGGTLVIDEADAFSMTESPCFDQLIRYGRNRYVNVVTGCRRPYEIPRAITSGADLLLIFQTQEPRDVEYFDKTLLGERAEQLMSLQAFHGIYIDYDDMTTGLFNIDLKGKIFKLTSESLNKQQNERN